MIFGLENNPKNVSILVITFLFMSVSFIIAIWNLCCSKNKNYMELNDVDNDMEDNREDVLEHNMGQYIESITKAVVPLIVYKYAPAIRNVAALMMPRLIRAACVCTSKNLLPANNALISNLLEFMIPNLLTQVAKETNMDVLNGTVEGIKLLLQTTQIWSWLRSKN